MPCIIQWATGSKDIPYVNKDTNSYVTGMQNIPNMNLLYIARTLFFVYQTYRTIYTKIVHNKIHYIKVNFPSENVDISRSRDIN